jgi:carbon-monoxide dehydrogenase medium subunit
VLAGKQPEERIIEQAARVAQEEATPITDVRGTAEYRREMVYLLTKKALNQAIHRAIEQDK